MNLNTIIKYLSKSIKEKPEIGIVLGSGLDFFSKSIQNKVIIPYEKIPTFFKTNVPGHKGEFIYGNINILPIINIQLFSNNVRYFSIIMVFY